MTLQEQREICARYAEQAYYALFEIMREHKDFIIAGMDCGLVVGWEQYEDRTWQKSHDELVPEVLAELRDAAVYMVMDLSRTEREKVNVRGGPVHLGVPDSPDD
jgi:hypothetical protein